MIAGTSQRLPRWVPRLAIAAGALLAALGVLTGLARMGWNIPLPHRARLTVEHGPLLVVGFFVTLIGLERAVAVGRRFMLLGPVAALASAVGLVLAAPPLAVASLLLLAYLGFAATFGYLLWVARTAHHAVMFAGALAWLGSGLLWTMGFSLPTIVPWWIIGFVLIITGERLELARVLRPDRPTRIWFFTAVTLLLVSTGLELVFSGVGARLRGFALLLLAAWLLRYDVARRGLRQQGVHRYSAVCLLHGYVWLVIGGLLALAYGHQQSGFLYDAEIHAVLLGFVVAQVFAHAPIIFPAVAGLRLAFRRFAYATPLALGLSLVVRLAGDLLADLELRRLGGLGNAFALALFAATTVLAALLARRDVSPHRSLSARLSLQSAGAGGEREGNDDAR
ncbi:MAG: hypothetical protein ACK42I_05730, partial [Thermomicrobium sp.]